MQGSQRVRPMSRGHQVLLTLGKLRVHDRGGGTLEKRVIIVPLGLELLLLKAPVLPEVTQVGQCLPDDQQEDADEHNARHGAPDDGGDVGALHTLSAVLHVDIIVVHPLALAQGEGHPAALRVLLLARLARLAPQGHVHQLQVFALGAAVLPKGALVEFQALNAGDVLAAGRGAAQALLAHGRLVPLLAHTHVATALSTAAALHALRIQAAVRGLLALARRALEAVVAMALAAGAGPPLFATADLAVVALTVHVVALAVPPEDLLVGVVAGVAHALPADAVPQPRADNGAVVLPAASLQLLAAPALRLALTVLPGVAGVAPADAALHGALAPAQATLLPLVPAPALTQGRTRTVTVSVKPRARMTNDFSWMHSEAVTFTWKVTGTLICTSSQSPLRWPRSVPLLQKES